MKLASLKHGGRDGTLIVVDRAVGRFVAVPEIATRLQQVLDDWQTCAPRLKDVSRALDQDPAMGEALDMAALAAPLPRAYQWLDGSAYLSHVERVRKARGAPMPPSFLDDPLMYQGASDAFMGSRDPIPLADESWGLDFESEVAVVTGDVPQGTSPPVALEAVRLIMLVNDVSLRNLIPAELAKGFGFLHGKPASAFSPVAVTPDELGSAWRGGKLHRPLVTELNGSLFGQPEAGVDMQFDFGRLISHGARSRALSAGTIVGSGTVSNQDRSRGASCLVERRVLEIIDGGEARTPFLRAGDRVRIDMCDDSGVSLFGAIEQEVIPWPS